MPDELERGRQALIAAESAVEAARDEMRLEAGALDERRLNELAAPIETKQTHRGSATARKVMRR